MRAGKLRHRITVTRPLNSSETTQDSFGEDQGGAADVGSFWCNVEAITGRELEVAQQRFSEASYKITLRRQSGVTFTTKMVAAWGSRTLDIGDVQDLGESTEPEVILLAKDRNP